jgi:F-type H+-transporting ATPase subunit a
MIFFAAVNPKASELFGIHFLTNSTVYAAVVVGLIVLFVQISLKKVTLVPAGLQNFCEWLFESLYVMLEGIVGHHMIRKTFPLLCTFFVFIFTANLSGLMPGVGTLGWGEGNSFFSTHVHDPLIRPANADLNMTLALTAIFFLYWFYWTFTEVGVGGFLKHLFAPKGLMGLKGKPLWLQAATLLLNIFLVVVFLLVGGIEVISIASRAISLPIRLYGNIFAGENLLHAMGGMGGGLGPLLSVFVSILVSIPFYIMEILVSLLQALVFTLLCAVYIQLSTAHEEGDHH